MKLLNQPFNGQLGSELVKLLDSGNYHTLNIIVAFAKNSGVLRLKDSISRFREHGGIVNVYVGVDLNGTSYEALANLHSCVDSLNVVHTESGQTFHTKIYDFVANDEALVIVGSHNLTGGGLWTNFESSVFIKVENLSSNATNLQKELEQHFSELQSLDGYAMHIKNRDDIEQLLDEGYVEKEIAKVLSHRNNQVSNAHSQPLFARGKPVSIPNLRVSALTPRNLATQRTSPSLEPRSKEAQTMWIETRKLTGGSRNILDLSKKSLIKTGNPTGTAYDHPDTNFMLGAVEFFGIDPARTTVRKEITLNFDGVDYMGNTVMFPSGKKANGTWRLQIKGVDMQGRKILDALARNQKHAITQSILVFSRIENDYYSVAVFPDNDIPGFISGSKFTGHNGGNSNARRLGFL